jgi:6,7-dimethyl-8-ribityllumazine synthase
MTDNSPEPSAADSHPRFAKPQRVAFVQSSWHRDIVAPCWQSFLAEMEARHIAPSQVDLFEVPGSFEIPLHVQVLAKTRRYTAIVAAGLVVDSGARGFVADTVIRALMDVQLRTEIPVFSAVTAPVDFRETDERAAFFRQHFAEKGVSVAAACAETLLSLERLRGQVAAGIV